VQKVFVAPGNGGTALDARAANVPITDLRAARLGAAEKIALTVVGPEAPLAAGVVDEFRAHGLRIFGPTKAAAQLESSKAFSQGLHARHGIPTADYETFTDPVPAHAYVDRLGAPIVIKADGLAAGKGVVVAMTLQRRTMPSTSCWGQHPGRDPQRRRRARGDRGVPAGRRGQLHRAVRRQERAGAGHQPGPQAPAGRRRRPQHRRHGRLFARARGHADVHARAMREIILPTIRGMEKDGIPFTGFLYAGLMIDAKGQPKTLEFNCRMGDPETQPILMRLKSDLVEVLLAPPTASSTRSSCNGTAAPRWAW
jgi:phosphoribosylamine--glycine ligase